MLDNFEFRFCFGNARLYITSTFKTITPQHTTFHDEFSSFFPASLNCVKIHFHGIFVYEWPHMISFIKGITN